MSKELKKYLSHSNITAFIGGTIFMALFPLCLSFVIKTGEVSIRNIFVLVFLPVASIGLIYVSFSEQRKMKKKFSEDFSFAASAERDFANAIQKRKDTVRFGDTFIFCKSSGTIIKYSEIIQIYQHVTKRNFVESTRCLECVDINGKKHTVCYLKLGDKSKDELLEMSQIILSHNPNIKVGYQ